MDLTPNIFFQVAFLFLADTLNAVFNVVYLYKTLIVHFGSSFRFLVIYSDTFPAADVSALESASWRGWFPPSFCPPTDHVSGFSVFLTGTYIPVLSFATEIIDQFHLPSCRPSVNGTFSWNTPSIPSNLRRQGIIATLVQLFYAWRVKVLTGKTWLVIVVVVLAVIGLRQFLQTMQTSKTHALFPLAVGALATTVAATYITRFVHFRKFKGAVIAWLAAECLCDIIITVALVRFLVRFFLSTSYTAV
jgi:hypothetical protein